ncbi:methionine synthase reductase-like [Helicoverpa zea]|uniref:methionine synthase reductase-like n=1 Tax=Helicoverpa zea TaxID=7113 RepID=UPI001F598640|nr:methionine synthase reductase-like [Helicoverpa zea]
MVVAYTFQDVIDILPETKTFSLPAFKPTPLKIEYVKDTSLGTTYCSVEPALPFANSDVFHASILSSRRLTATSGDCKAVYEVTFDVEDSKFEFKAGDTIGVIPHNDESDVNLIISHLNLVPTVDLSYRLTLDDTVKGAKIPVHVPIKSTIRHVLTHCLDLRSILKKAFLLALSKYTKNDKEKQLLEYFCSKEGSAAYSTHFLNKSLCILDIFTIFQSCKPPIEVLLANLPRLFPRPYSIVNSGLKDNRELKICFSVIEHERKGLTTSWLERLALNEDSLENGITTLSISNEVKDKQKVSIYLRKNLNMFCLPDNAENPLILIGPGTGVSPFIGFLEERKIMSQHQSDIRLGETWLYFGCRNPELDFIYEEELNQFLSEGILNKLFVAFSRIDHHKHKYIQDALRNNGKEITQLIKEGASVFVCGDLKTMAAEVKEILIKCFVDHENMSLQEAQDKITEMQKEKKYVVDAWC